MKKEKTEKQSLDTKGLIIGDNSINFSSILDTQPSGMLQLTTSSNVLLEDDNVFGVTIQNSILDTSYNIYNVASASNLTDPSLGVQVNVPETLSFIDNSIISGTTISSLISNPSDSVMISPIVNTINQDAGVLTINSAFEPNLSSLGIHSPSSAIQLNESMVSLKATTIDNLDINKCGAIRITSDDNEEGQVFV